MGHRKEHMNSTHKQFTESNNTLIGQTGQQFRLNPVERCIIERLGGKAWTAQGFTPARLAEAKRMWRVLSQSAGFAGAGRWTTDESTNPKLGKSGLPTVGVTLLAATSAKEEWASTPSAVQNDIARVVGATTADITRAMGLTVCPCSTVNCISPCVTDQSFRARFPAIRRTRLIRNVMSVWRPDLALCLTADALRSTVERAGGITKARWRVNIADDIRWELVAPGLLDFAPLAYTYTKLPVAERPQLAGLRIVYSANERWSNTSIVDACNSGHRVAVVFGVPKKKLPEVWNGVIVQDGDSTDDLYEHPQGRIVGLYAKGRNREIIAKMSESGFARAV